MDSQTPSPSSSSSTRSADTINAYSPHFETELRRRRVFFLRGRTEQNPIDVNDFKSFVSRARGSPEPTEEDVQRIRVKADRSRNEAAVVQSILPELLPVDDLYTSDDFETIPNQQWDKRVSLPVPAISVSVADDNGSPSRKRKAPGSIPGTTRRMRLAVPKPDQAIGISSESLTCYNAREHLGHVCTPVAADSDLLFPFFTAECKGDQGRLKVSRMQNGHNAAVMLHNMRRLHCAASNDAFGVKEELVDPFVDDEEYNSTAQTEDMRNHVDKDDEHDTPERDTFYNHIHAVTLSLSTESIELCYHWASPSEHTAKKQKCADSPIYNNTDINVCSRPLNTWSLSSESHNDYVMARRCVRNALDWCRNRTAGWVRCKMRQLEDRLCRKGQFEDDSQLVKHPKRQKRARTERSSSRSSQDRAIDGSCGVFRKNATLEAEMKTRTKPRPKQKPSMQNQCIQQRSSPPTPLKRSGSGLKVELDMELSDNDDNNTQPTARTDLMTFIERLCPPSTGADDNGNDDCVIAYSTAKAKARAKAKAKTNEHKHKHKHSYSSQAYELYKFLSGDDCSHLPQQDSLIAEECPGLKDPTTTTTSTSSDGTGNTLYGDGTFSSDPSLPSSSSSSSLPLLSLPLSLSHPHSHPHPHSSASTSASTSASSLSASSLSSSSVSSVISQSSFSSVCCSSSVIQQRQHQHQL